MGLATIDPHSQKEHTEINKSPSLVFIRLVLTEIQRSKNVKINKEMLCMAMDLDALSDSVRMGFCKTWSALDDYVDQ